MPYITQERRKVLANEQLSDGPTNAGELNYAISCLIDDYLFDRGRLRYQNINEVVGVLECAKLEVYRRLAAPYEDTKIAENGDVYKVLDK
jgi:hypothetical protein